MKWNWGKGIFLTFIIFFSGIALIIIFPFNQKVDLVTENYYKEELLYQDQINKINRTNNLSEKIRVEHTKDILKINYPESYKNIRDNYSSTDPQTPVRTSHIKFFRIHQGDRA